MIRTFFFTLSLMAFITQLAYAQPTCCQNCGNIGKICIVDQIQTKVVKPELNSDTNGSETKESE